MQLRQMSAKHMKQVVKFGLKLAVPHENEDVAVKCAEEQLQKTLLPSKSTLNRTRGRLEVCKMLEEQMNWTKILEAGVTVWWGIDGSPHGHLNYEVGIGRVLKHDDAPQLHCAVCCLGHLCVFLIVMGIDCVGPLFYHIDGSI